MQNPALNLPFILVKPQISTLPLRAYRTIQDFNTDKNKGWKKILADFKMQINIKIMVVLNFLLNNYLEGKENRFKNSDMQAWLNIS